jgi:hypothetical protein
MVIDPQPVRPAILILLLSLALGSAFGIFVLWKHSNGDASLREFDDLARASLCEDQPITTGSLGKQIKLSGRVP